MTFSARNLGPVKRGDVELGGLTVVCGKNNNGKTYLTYALGTFLGTIKSNIELSLEESCLSELLERGEVEIDLNTCLDLYLAAVQEKVPRFKDSLARFLAMHPDKFANTQIDVSISREELLSKISDEQFVSMKTEIRVSDKVRITVERERSRPLVSHVVLINQSDTMPSRSAISHALSFIMARVFDDTNPESIFPATFVITCERTGVVLFRQELVKNRKNEGREYPVRANLNDIRANKLYQRPVEKELEFVLNLGAIQSNKSVISSAHPEILEMLSKISGGEYMFDASTNQVRFVPSGSVEESLSLPESSSTVRSLAELYFYLKHVAAPGQLLMFDEPELNLHPSNQRILARLLAALVNIGVKVFITTHSDYIVRELNALIRIGNIKLSKQRYLFKKYCLNKSCLLRASNVKIYMLQDGVTCPIEYDPEAKAFGVRSFDDTIDYFNQLYSDVRSLDV